MTGKVPSSKSIQDAEKIFDKAESLSRKSLFCWFPDYDSAAELFEKSGKLCMINTLYLKVSLGQLMKSGNKSFEAMNCFVRAGECYSQSHNWFLAAKNYTHAAECAQIGAKLKQSSQLYTQSALLYAKCQPKVSDLVSKSYIKAGLMLIKQSRGRGCISNLFETQMKSSAMISSEVIQQATKQFTKACKVLEKEGREMICRESYHEMASSLIEQGYLEHAKDICFMAMKAAEKYKEVALWSQYCFSILILISCSEHTDKSFFEKQKKTFMMTLCPPLTRKCMESWIEGIQKSDSRILSTCISNPLIQNLPVREIYLLAQSHIRNLSGASANK